MLVEDDADTGEAMTLLLRSHGIHVDWASSGGAALEFFREDPPRAVDVILLDLMLPDMDGASLIGKLRKMIHVPPIVIHSAATGADVTESGRRLGAVAILRKPTDWPTLLEVLEGCRPATTARER
jgi:two-component system OmpR family response regulator